MKYLSYQEVKTHAQSLGLKSNREWREYCKSINKPRDIPTAVDNLFKDEFEGWGEFLGTGNRSSKREYAGKIKYLSYEDSKKIVQNLKLKSVREWRKNYIFNKLQNKIPKYPDAFYRSEFEGWGEFLGTGNKALKNVEYVTYQEAKKFAQSLDLKSFKQWKEYCISGKKPSNIPTSISSVYKNEFEGWGEFLGTGNVSNINIEFIKYNDAKKIAQSLGLKSQQEWKKYCISGNKPSNIPSDPRVVYKNEFEGWGIFLGTGNVSNKNIEFIKYNDAKKFAQSLDLKSFKQWKEYCISGKKPSNIPTSISSVYKNEFEGWGEFLGTGIVSNKNIEYLTYNNAKKFAQSLGLRSCKEWQKYCISGNKPSNIPSDPRVVYKNEFEGYSKFIGTGRIANQNKKFMSYNDAKKFVQSLGLKLQKEWRNYCKTGKRPDYIPSNVQRTYKKEFEGWGKFLGDHYIDKKLIELFSRITYRSVENYCKTIEKYKQEKNKNLEKEMSVLKH